MRVDLLSQAPSILQALQEYCVKATIRWGSSGGVHTRNSHSGISTALRLGMQPIMQTTSSTSTPAQTASPRREVGA